MQFRQFLETDIPPAQPQTLVAYHQTSPEGARKIKRYGFNLRSAAQPIVWFTTDVATLRQDSIGAAGRGAILKVQVTFTKPAGWAEYEKLMLGQIRNDGYDAVLLDNKDGTLDGFVFNPKQIKVLEILTAI